ncbi:MAG TPA: DUF2267 domain-containing protein [Acidimicrobiales bacterium]|nr:DUF2267 domain-containing protein [Acidimicrobiales bacterium]
MRTRTPSLLAGAAAGVAVMLRPGTRANKLVRRELGHAGRRLRYLEGRIRGATYRLSGHQPDPTVIDNVLADRVRSSLGKLEHRLDLPHIHVMVEDHVALLHGEVDNEKDAHEIERAVAAVPGVAGVESHLHTGLTRGDTRPSAGRAAHPPSAALSKLLTAAQEAGAGAAAAPALVQGVLGAFASRLPEGEREHVAAHLPADVRPFFTPPRRIPGARPVRTVHDLVGRAASEVPFEVGEQVSAAVVHALRGLVPEEGRDVAAVLPPELRALWEGTGQS